MSLITMLVVLLGLVIVLWIINYLMDLPSQIRLILNIIIAVALTLWVIFSLGGGDIRIGR